MSTLDISAGAAPAIVVLTASGAVIARRIAQQLPGAQVHGYRARVVDADQFFDEVGLHLRSLFQKGQPLVAVCSTGIVVRSLAAVLDDKRQEPAVVVVSDSGSAVIPLLGAHHGGNVLAERIAAELGVASALTTASDQRFAMALDQPPDGYVLATPDRYKSFVARLLAAEPMRIVGDASWLRDSGLPLRDDATLTLCVSHKRVDALGSETDSADADTLVIHPRDLVVGVGCERGCDRDEIVALVRETLRTGELSEDAVAAVVSLDLKSDEPAVHALASSLGVPARFFSADVLEAQTPRLRNPSEVVFREVGCHGVAEGAVLAAIGDGRLLVDKRKSKRATCAIGALPSPIDALSFGRARGELAVVGLGPGGRSTCTPHALTSLDSAQELVGYRLYLDLAGLAADDLRRHDFDLGEERERVRHALDLAAAGRRVALVCSGDPGIYAMASLVFEELETADRADWRRVAVEVVSGTSAMQAAAALAGAPLGHDFCAISLSDLLTPWADIERRIEAAAAADFVVAFYNPVSRRRTRQLARALEILRACRPADTPVMLGRNLGRDGESMTICRLAELQVAQVDMLTVVLVGSSQTRQLDCGDGRQWVYTPRGYALKREALDACVVETSIEISMGKQL